MSGPVRLRPPIRPRGVDRENFYLLPETVFNKRWKYYQLTSRNNNLQSLLFTANAQSYIKGILLITYDVKLTDLLLIWYDRYA